MSATTEKIAVEIELHIEASPQTIFEFLTEPDKMTRWMGSMAELDPRAGGIYRVSMHNGLIARGEYVEVRPFDLVIFTFGWDEPDAFIPSGSTTVEITLTAQDNGTLLKLVHRDLKEAAASDHIKGWERYLNRLAIVVTGGDPGPEA